MSVTEFRKRVGLKDHTVTEKDLKKVYNFSFYPRHSILSKNYLHYEFH